MRGRKHRSPFEAVGWKQCREIQEALKSPLQQVGVRSTARQLGKPDRFFQYCRYHGTIQLADFLTTCAALELDPAAFIGHALSGGHRPDIRPPRILHRAREQLEAGGTGIGDERLMALEGSLRQTPLSTGKALQGALPDATPEEVPMVLGFYGSALRIQSALVHAELVIKEALAMAASRPSLEADLLIRLSYVSLDQEKPQQALAQAKDGTLAAMCSGKREMIGRGFAATGTFHYYTADHHHALRDASSALLHLDNAVRLVAAHQTAAFALIALGRGQDADGHLQEARQCAREAPTWVQGKVTWLEARMAAEHEQRIELLRQVKAMLESIPADCLLVTVELVEELLAVEQTAAAAAEIPHLCTLVEEAAEGNRVQQAVSRLVRRRSTLTKTDVGKLRRTLERAQDRRLSYLIGIE